MTALLLTLAIFPLAGAGAALSFRLPLPKGLLASIAFLFLLGLGAQGTFLHLLGLLRVPLGTIAHLALPAIGAAIVIVRRARFAAMANGARERHVLSAIVFAVPLVVLLAAAAVMPVRDYDGRVTWLPKARAIALEQSITGPYFHGQRGLNLHNRYPLLLPLDVATVMHLTGDTRNETGRWIYVLIAVSGLVVTRGFLIAQVGASGAWISAATAWLPILTKLEGGALASYNDLALTAFAGVSILFLLDGEERAAGLFAAFAVMTKNEGLALAAGILAAALVLRRLTWRVWIPIAAAQGLVAFWRRLVPPAYDEQYDVLLRALPRFAGRFSEAVAAIVREALDVREWGLFWIAVVAAAAVAALAVRERRPMAALVMMALALASYAAALTVTSWNIAELAPVAVDRLLVQILIPASAVLTTIASVRSRSR